MRHEAVKFNCHFEKIQLRFMRFQISDLRLGGHPRA